MASQFSHIAWQRNEYRYVSIRDMPFNAELANGSLTPDRFRHYIIQDAHYLVTFGQALAAAAGKSEKSDYIVQFAQAAQEAIVVERALHGQYFRLFDVSTSEALSTPLSPTTHHYRSFLLATAFREPLPVIAAALLPCFWIYAEVGRHIHSIAQPGNAYQAWIDTYAGSEFEAAVTAMRATTDELAEEQGSGIVAAMHEAFTTATRLEWMFWDFSLSL